MSSFLKPMNKYLVRKKYFSKKNYERISQLFCLGKMQAIRKLPMGFEANKVTIVAASGKYVVSAYPISKKKSLITKSRESLRYEINLIKKLKALPIPDYVASRNKNFIEIFSKHYVTVYRFLRGEHPQSINSLKAKNLGEFLGRFHAQSSKLKINSTKRRKFYLLTPKVKKEMDPFVRQQKNSEVKSFYTEVRKGIDKFSLPRKLPQGHIHVDIKPDNELFIGDRLTGILDFGISYPGPFILDIARAIIINCNKKGRLNQNLYNSFLRGYSKYRKLTQAERKWLKHSLIFITYAMIYVDMYHVPFGRVHPDFPMHWIKKYLPGVRELQKKL